MTIKELRKSKGYSQKEICEFLHIPLRTYKRYEMEQGSSKYKYELIYQGILSLNKIVKRKSVKKCDIAVIGTGNIGLSMGLLLSIRNRVTFIEKDHDKINDINKKNFPFDISPISRIKDISKLHVQATSDIANLKYKDLIFICLPIDYIESSKQLNFSTIEYYMKYIYENCKNSIVLIRSTLPFGYCEKLQNMYPDLEIIYFPTFARSGYELTDTMNAFTLIFGVDRINLKNKKAAKIIESITSSSINLEFMSFAEAEGTKLYSNGYLSMRSAFFNEIDSFAMENNVSSKSIIKCLSLDPRIGSQGTNPNFGVSGYQIPKDIHELTQLVGSEEENIISSVIRSNKIRKEEMIELIMKKANVLSNGRYPVIGVYKINKSSSYKNSAMLDIISSLKLRGANVIIFDDKYPGATKDWDYFLSYSNLIVTESMDERLLPYKDRVFTRDINY